MTSVWLIGSARGECDVLLQTTYDSSLAWASYNSYITGKKTPPVGFFQIWIAHVTTDDTGRIMSSVVFGEHQISEFPWKPHFKIRSAMDGIGYE